jgi:NAD(P)-dependent dehydrogenase (short-subunit alcohol dehydrogenase family)
MIGRNEAALQSIAAELGALCAYRVFDLQQIEGIPALVDGIASEYGNIDILINNAGINQKKPFLEVTDADFCNIIQTNVLAVFAISREVAKHMVAADSGSILNISSMAAQYGIPQVIAYTAAKSGIEGMTKAMAVELSPLGIRVNCIAPGFIKTAMSSKALDNDPERKNKVLSRTPMGHLGLPEDVADAAFYLTSNQAKYITGVILPVDGGNSIGF